MQYNNFFVSIKKTFLCILIINLLPVAYCKEQKNIDQYNDSSWLEAIKRQEDLNWEEFKKQKELIDINYDLYRMRMRGPNLKEQITSAQDPRGYFIYKHDTTFCSPQIDSKCQLNSPLYSYGDIKISLLLDNIYAEKDKIDLATEVIRNIVNPFPSNLALEMLEASEQVKKNPKNQAALAELYASQARLGVARNTFHHIFFNRLPLDSLSTQKSREKEKFSVISIMEEQAKSRFENASWHQLIESADFDTKIKEIAKMDSFKIWLDFQKFKQNERIESLLATLVAQQETMQQLLSQKNAKNN